MVTPLFIGTWEIVIICFIILPITIPRAEGSLTESLNASIAAAIIMAQMSR